jgi:single-stranded-DNA-specific exonuclease
MKSAQQESQRSGPSSLFEGKVSVGGRRWVWEDANPRETLHLAQNHGIGTLAASILLKRGVTFQTAEAFLNPTLRELMPDPSHLKDMDKGVDRIVRAIKARETLAVFGDYDVDGGTTTALLKRYFNVLGLPLRVYIPQRIEEGYGPTIPALQRLATEGTTTLLMVDCGTTAFEPLEEAARLGMDVVILDHHLSQASLPPAVALINPNRLDENSPLTHLCAVGLGFMFLVALNRRLRQEGWFTPHPEPDLRQYLDLVALGTVCDVMPLTGLNRAFVAQGLKVLARRTNVGLRALADVAGLEDTPSTYHLGFLLGPRLNAGGRVGRADYGSRLLSTLDELEAQRLAKELDLYNKERQAIENLVLEEAMVQIQRHGLDRHPIILVGQEGWHPGVVGIVAGRLKERYNRPACVVSFDGDVGKGSGRSITGVNLGAAMHTACHKGLLTIGGGHAMAAGFTVMRDQVEPFYGFLRETLHGQIEAIDPVLEIDGLLTPSGATLELVREIKLLEPFGNGNPTPKFCIHRAKVTYAEQVGLNHIRCSLEGEDGTRLKAMAFRALGTPLGDAIMAKSHRPIEVAGTLKADSWNGRQNVTCFIEDVM